MFKHVLVPLDGSQLAEAALPVAAYLARTLGSRVTLMHIIEQNPPREIHGEQHLADLNKARTYLHKVATQTFDPDLNIQEHVHPDKHKDIARSLLEWGQALEVDLIVMCTHGRGGVRSWLYGSIAQQVVSRGIFPVLVVQPNEAYRDFQFSCDRMLLPLDGNPDHEKVLPIAVELAKACKANLHLVMVIHTVTSLTGERSAAARLLPGVTAEILDLARLRADEYLREMVFQLRQSGVEVSTEIGRGDPTRFLTRTARSQKSDLIVLGTHGRTGMDAFWSGSVAPKISSRTRLPILLVPVQPS